MKKAVGFLTVLSMFLGCGKPASENVSVNAVEEAVELFREVMLMPDQETFEALFAESLTYGHSNGLIEGQTTCIASMVSGRFKFTSLDFSEQMIQIVDNTAIVRHVLFGHTADEGKEPGTIHLHVLQVWIQNDNGWQLLARQAVRI